MLLFNLIYDPWPWYVAGPLITLTMLLIGYWGKSFGISSTMRTMCAAIGGGKFSDLFDFEWKRDIWNLVFILGAIVGGFLTSTFLANHDLIGLSQKTIHDLKLLNIEINPGLVPNNLFSWEGLFTLKGFFSMVIGGFLVGFGTRYAGGCTSGHAITGLSNFQLPSLYAVIGFFIGGLIMTHLLFPFIF